MPVSSSETLYSNRKAPNRRAVPEEPVILEHQELGSPSPEQMPGILRLAWPAVVGNLLMSVVGIVDIKILRTVLGGRTTHEV